MSLVMTAYQVTGTVQQYINQPDAVSIEPLAPGDSVLYPTLQLCYQHWVYWADFETALKLNFSKSGFLYGMSHLSDVFTESAIDVDEAKENFYSSMEANNFATLSEFYKAIARRTPENGDQYQAVAPKKTLFVKSGVKLIYSLNMPVFCYSIPSEVILKTIRENVYNFSDTYGAMKNTNDRKTLTFYVAEEDEQGEEENVKPKFVTNSEYNCYLAHYFFAYSDRYLKSEKFKKNIGPLPRLPMLLFVDEHNTFEVKVHWKYSEINMRVKASVYESRSSCVAGARSTSDNNTCELHCETEYNLQNCLCPNLEWASKAGEDYPTSLCSYKIWLIDNPESCIGVLREKFNNSIDFRSAISPTVATNATKDAHFCPTNDFVDNKCCRLPANNSDFRDCIKTCQKNKACEIWTHEISVSTTNSESKDFDEITGKSSVQVNILYPLGGEILHAKKIDIQTWDNFIGNVGGLLGVWTGASLISIFQIFYLCCCAECSFCPRKSFASVRDKKPSIMGLKRNNLAGMHFHTVG